MFIGHRPAKRLNQTFPCVFLSQTCGPFPLTTDKAKSTRACAASLEQGLLFGAKIKFGSHPCHCRHGAK